MARGCSVLLLFVCTVLHAEDGLQVINWAINDSPPFHIVAGEQQGEGFCDQLIDNIEALLPEYQHTRQVIPQARISQLRKQRQPVCFPCMIKKIHTADTRYSKATHLYPPHQIIARPERADAITQAWGNPVSLAGLLSDSSFWLGQPKARKYGETLQPLLDVYGDNTGHINKINAVNGAMGVLEMITLNRLDYTIDYPAIGRHYQKLTESELVYLPIAENQHEIIVGAIGCSNTPWGRNAIKVIDGVNNALRHSAAFHKTLQHWFADYDSQYWQRFERMDELLP